VSITGGSTTTNNQTIYLGGGSGTDNIYVSGNITGGSYTNCHAVSTGFSSSSCTLSITLVGSGSYIMAGTSSACGVSGGGSNSTTNITGAGVSNSTIKANATSGSGNGVTNGASMGPLNITSCAISGCTAGTSTGYGVYNASSTASSLTLNTVTLTGGNSAASYAVYCPNSAPVVTSPCSIACGTAAVGYAGYPISWTPAAADEVNFTTTSGNKMALEPSAANLLSGVSCGSTTGSFVHPAASSVLSSAAYGSSGGSGTFVDPGVNNVLTTASYGSSGGSGNYTTAPVADVKNGYQFGVGGTGSTGTYAPPTGGMF
jgi:hypothetical protein